MEADVPSNRDWKTFVSRAWRGRCPRCGAGALFVSRYCLAQRCEHCALVYRRESGAMTGQMYLTAVVSQLFAAALVLVMFFFTDWGPWTAIPVGLVAVVFVSYAFLPRGMALWVAIEFMTDVGNREPWVRE